MNVYGVTSRGYSNVDFVTSCVHIDQLLSQITNFNLDDRKPDRFRIQRTDAPLRQVVILVTVEVVFVAALTPTGDGVSLGAVSVLIDDATVTSQPSQPGPV